MEREQGFYWVKYVGEWVISYYHSPNFWLRSGAYMEDFDSDYEEIDEDRIVRNKR